MRALPSSGSEEGRPVVIPAPTGGWNASDPIAKMKPTDAVFLDNFFPEASDVRLRNGAEKLGTITEDTPTSPHNIRTLMGYSPVGGAVKIFAACEAGIYDVTNGDQLTIASAATSGEFQWTNITTAGGSFLWACNGVDNPKTFDGSAWATPSVTGLTPSTIANVSLHKRRLIFCQTNSLSFWYLDTNSIAGAASEFPLGALFAKGGYLMATTSWTVDAGDGEDDFFVAITSEGEVAVYRGIDPSSDATWSLVGVYFLGKPMCRRCFTRYAGDVAVLTRGAVLLLSSALQSASLDRKAGLTKKIHRAYSDYAAKYFGLFGWQMAVFPEGPFVLINVPVLNYAVRNIIYSYQFVMNTATGAWCRFTGWNAECWLAVDGRLYFAVNDTVYEAWVGTADNGANIVAKAKTAFNYLSSGKLKHVSLVQPNIATSGTAVIQLGIDVDYTDSSVYSGALSYDQTLTVWDTAIFNQSRWTGSTVGQAEWRTVPAKPGRAVSIRLRLSANNVTMTWNTTNLIVKDGGLM